MSTCSKLFSRIENAAANVSLSYVDNDLSSCGCEIGIEV